MAENNLGNTQYFRTKPDQELEVKEVLDLVYNAMEEKGYNPVNQIVGYIVFVPSCYFFILTVTPSPSGMIEVTSSSLCFNS